ncbi:VCBS repeat-containing protein [Seonamhaeicola sp.]|uniref:VCBS repeat-containing protein n=1 Tax=Seonamhaeicola sp. TaxID=1912245 RepID=UPI0026397AC4|nr:VCBS repeat-containing protein [Seonamhaeicola sp.]
MTLLFYSCGGSSKKNKDIVGLKLIDPKYSGVNFKNQITESDSLNYYNFPYIFMGGGVSIGDINNDGLSDIFFSGNMSSNKLYLNRGNMQFQDITETAGIVGGNQWYTGTTMADVNNDGWLDIYVCVSSKYKPSSNQLFINNQDNTFTERAEEYGLDDSSSSIQATFFDYDNDGLLDVFVVNYPLLPISMGNEFYHRKVTENEYSESAHLFRNNGNGTFSDVTEQANVKNFGLTLGVIASDLNNDGWKDLYVSNDFNVPDYLYLNNADGTFKEIIKEATNQTSQFGMGVDASDFNNDGFLDILQMDMTSDSHFRSKTNMASMSQHAFEQAVDLGFHYQYMHNMLQFNNGVFDTKPVFSNVSRLAGVAATDWSWAGLFCDLNNDGFEDIYITNGIKRDVNNNDANEKLKSQSFFGKVLKYNPEIFPSSPLENSLFINNGDLTFRYGNEDWRLENKGFSNGAAYADLDNDGDLDLVVNNIDEEAYLIENKCSDRATGNNNYLKIKLIGSKSNPFGIGSKVVLSNGNSLQVKELTLSRGFQSSVEPLLHYGLGKKDTVDELKITWPDGSSQVLNSVKGNRTFTLDYKNASKSKVLNKRKVNEFPVFTDITNQLNIDFLHKEDFYDDFRIEPLLPHKNSQIGPGLAVGDVNGDGLEDFFIGNASGYKAAMYYQNKEGHFKEVDGPWLNDYQFEDTGVLLEDFDNDNDLDLYIVSGGNNGQLEGQYYEDRLYVNNNGVFTKCEDCLPKIQISGKTVIAGDIDKDGDLDLFVGGRIVPGKYPSTPPSYVLKNEGGLNDRLNFTNVTENLNPELTELGMVTDARWCDFDADNDLDLVVVGEWMGVTLFENTSSGFNNVSHKYGLSDTAGWWRSIEKMDVDNDGDMDFVIGNYGLNSKYKTSLEEPFEIYSNDFDENNSLDIVLSKTKKGKRLPVRGRECSSQQIPAIAKRFETYNEFALASLEDVYGESMLSKSMHFKLDTFEHIWLENTGTKFNIHRLPNRAQSFAINACEVIDYKEDGTPHIIIAGNLFDTEVETPRNDAGIGLLLSPNANSKKLDVIAPSESRLMIKDEVKVIKKINLANGETGVLFARNNSTLKLFKLKNE